MDLWIFGFVDFWISNFWIFGFLDFGFLDFWFFGFRIFHFGIFDCFVALSCYTVQYILLFFF